MDFFEIIVDVLKVYYQNGNMYRLQIYFQFIVANA